MVAFYKYKMYNLSNIYVKQLSVLLEYISYLPDNVYNLLYT